MSIYSPSYADAHIPLGLEPCAYCGSLPTLLRLNTTDKLLARMGRLSCFQVGCPGQSNQNYSTNFLTRWNKRQQAQKRTIDKAKSVQPLIVAQAGGGV